jgi:hypothetical protein
MTEILLAFWSKRQRTDRERTGDNAALIRTLRAICGAPPSLLEESSCQLGPSKPTSRHVRSNVANGVKADNICSV